MKRLLTGAILALALLPSTSFAQDTTPPAQVQNFTLGLGRTTVTAEFTMVGDDGNSGTPSWVQIRRHTSPIDDNNWPYATIVHNGPNSTPAGYGVCYDLDDAGAYPCNTHYYYAVKITDEVDNESPLANTDGSTLSCSPFSPEVTCILLLPKRGGELAAPPVEAKGHDLIGMIG